MSALLHCLMVWAVSNEKETKGKEAPKFVSKVTIVESRSENRFSKFIKKTSLNKLKKNINRENKNSSKLQLSKEAVGAQKKSDLSYKSLFPGSGEIQLNAPKSSEQNIEYKGENKDAIIANFGDLTSEISLPLVFRREIDKGYANATIQLVGEENVLIKSLYGNSMLRASLFGILSNSKVSLRFLRELKELFDSAIFDVAISVTTTSEPYGSEFEYKIKVFEKKAILEVLKHLSFPKFGEGNLPDEHSEKAKKRDREEFSKLLDSPAYRAPIYNYQLRF